MNTEILTRMSLDGLRKLEAALKVELESRLDYSVAVGRTAYFTTTKTKTGGEVRVHCMIERVNQKTVSVVELGDSLRAPGTKWKVPAAMLRVEPVERHAHARIAPVSSKPMTTARTAW